MLFKIFWFTIALSCFGETKYTCKPLRGLKRQKRNVRLYGLNIKLALKDLEKKIYIYFVMNKVLKLKKNHTYLHY